MANDSYDGYSFEYYNCYHNFNPNESLNDDLNQLGQELDQLCDEQKLVSTPLPKCVDRFLNRIELKLEHYEPVDSSNKFGHGCDDVIVLMSAIQRLGKLVKIVSGETGRVSSSPVTQVMNKGSSLLHRAMAVLEDQVVLILEHWKAKNSPSSTNPNKGGGGGINASMRRKLTSLKSSTQRNQHDNADHQEQTSDFESETMTETFSFYSTEDIYMMSLICRNMILAGYTSECIGMFEITRRAAFEEELRVMERMSMEEVQRMQWESLEGEIATWIRILKRCSSHLFPCELRFYQDVFESASSSCDAWKVVYSKHAWNVIQQLVSFAHAVAITPRSSEKLFKLLDMYESMRELRKWIEKDGSALTREVADDLRIETEMAGEQLGEAAVSIFSDLADAISNDNSNQPVPSGNVHPLIRYSINYLKYACEYKDTLDELFRLQIQRQQQQQQQQEQQPNILSSRFAEKLMSIIDLLSANLEAKANLYKDPSLKSIFLMNNGRYMLQKIRGSPDIRQAIGDTWYRNKSSQMRSYHKSYQRDTWSKVLHCLSTEGLLLNSKLQKPILKERFKNFNQLFDDIYKTQSTWVVSDEQLKSELRVSISAVMIPAYRAFLARYAQVFTPGRQYEKHVKYQPDDIEAIIEELFDGNPTSVSRRKT